MKISLYAISGMINTFQCEIHNIRELFLRESKETLKFNAEFQGIDKVRNVLHKMQTHRNFAIVWFSETNIWETF